MTRSRHTSALRPLCGLCALGAFLALGCGEQIEVANTPAVIEEVREVSRLEATDAVRLRYTLRDDEGDDQQLFVRVCEAGGAACGLPFQGQGSDGVTFVPTAPARSAQLHQFVWDAGCGRVVEGAPVATTLEQSYIFRIGVLGREDSIKQSEPFTLQGLGVSALPDCPQG